MRKRVTHTVLVDFYPSCFLLGKQRISLIDSFTFAVMSDNHVYKGGFGEMDLEECWEV